MTRHPVAQLPLVYVPQGYVSLKEVLVRGAEMLRPMEDVRGLVFSDSYLAQVGFDPLREPPDDVLDPFSWAPAAPSSEYAALEEVRHRIRWFLAEGKLEATGQTPEGELEPILQGFWRTDAGADALRFPSRIALFSQVFVREDALMPWLRTIPHWYSLGEAVVPETSDDADNQVTPQAKVRTVPDIRIRSWLEQKIQTNDPLTATGKPRVFEAARTALGEGVSGKAFSRAWAAATESTGRNDLRRQGRKPRPLRSGSKSTPPNRFPN